MAHGDKKIEWENLVFDFDSTLVTVESLDELAGIALRGNPKRESILADIARITKLGMEGALPFSESLSRRLKLFSATRGDIDELVTLLMKSITPSVARHRDFFARHQDRVYVLSSGFKEYIEPVVGSLGIPAERVVANSFLFDGEGRVTGADLRNPLTGDKGKVVVVTSLGLGKGTLMIGDGYTDYEVRKEGAAEAFILFSENVSREGVIAVADKNVANMEEFLYLLGISPS
ncbi:MAG: HAD-IB family phosphatase [Patescibacteria group bacterium]